MPLIAKEKKTTSDKRGLTYTKLQVGKNLTRQLNPGACKCQVKGSCQK
jgi:hypothetical protein